MTQHKRPDSGFFDDQATHAMSEAFVMALRALKAQQINGGNSREDAILRRRVADAVLELAGSGTDCEMIAHGVIDRIRASSRFRTV